MPLTIRRCPPAVHQALKGQAKANKRSVNAEVLLLLERAELRKPVSGAELAERVRKAEKLLTQKERMEFGQDIERGIELMRRERLH